MYTRFRIGDRSHLLTHDLGLKFSPQTPGALFLALLGSAYEQTNGELRVQVLREAEMLLWVLATPEQSHHIRGPASKAASFAAELERLIAFLSSADGPTVEMFSFDKRPTIEDILQAGSGGGGAADWAIEEVGGRAAKGRQELLKILSDPSKSEHHLSAVRLLLLVFPDEETNKAVNGFIDSCADRNIGRQAMLIAAAYSQARGDQQ